ncbi:deoxyguanosinetriphosphate triphosphohydrolase [Alkalidesulfovibrio alkalitolerans DSM 16529]|jgi:dGTPase|uniref:Deoxyguanosinetriphosphate triphosphohydrolase n=1 Tax=Alkalidesulfovibrio alkalitolerans DSM 16529 TaxID=1121439 RepID=S7UT04_9BACT|nr:deoxyguanosinetriphosphate triphosphohydrolase [Alkalidesulfovibrio alkalitolerans]EPR35438.1 deoxyguanosinetriphosphate triphosphohydrolase [Alkalidesulfovibrio alkalitolerans DSM 16529]
MDWTCLLSPRRHPERENAPGDPRSEFLRDYDRIVFSTAFRRLGRKTQVHPLTINDHVHTRLTHSIETGSVGRSLGLHAFELLRDELPPHTPPAMLGEIVQAACLAHDIGNPPFGHAGEEAVRAFFAEAPDHLVENLSPAQRLDLATFEGNAQGFRIVTRLEMSLNAGGMRLTLPTLGALLKYPWTSEHPVARQKGKFSCYLSERATLDEIAQRLGLPPGTEGGFARHPLAFLVEAADDICYSILDLEDARELGLLSFAEIMAALGPLADSLGGPARDASLHQRRRLSYIRSQAIGRAVEDAARAFADHHRAILAGAFEKSLLDVCSEATRQGIAGAKELARGRIYTNTRKIELEIGSFSAIGGLLQVLCTAVWEKLARGRVSGRGQRLLRVLGEHAPPDDATLYEGYMRVLDYVSGMTDQYATLMAKQIGGLAENLSVR